HAMQNFTESRGESTGDEIWLLEHSPVFTLGLAGKAEHVLDPGAIPIIRSDRGGQVTYHGPGQLVAYLLLDLHRLGLGVRQLVERMEESVIALLGDYGIAAGRKLRAPGVYVAGAKIAAVALRVKRGASYHGLALNVDMDLEPFSRIDPCGYPGLAVTQIRNLGVRDSIEEIGDRLLKRLSESIASPKVF
ncbi:MAG: lipoyl(octanoyl) transferase LipB, partial [Burkholderiales bacterium]|nr:lipoyl(octanoyl) transferase LipB [Burkholderiales bacterium]